VAKTVSAQIPAGGQATLNVVAGEIWFGAAACPGATTANTNTIAVTAPAGSTEQLVIDQQAGGPFAPGATLETGTGALSEIEISVNLGDPADLIVLHGTSGDDAISIGTNGVAVNADGDVDVTFGTVPAAIQVWGGAGRNTIVGRGGSGTGTSFPGSLTLHAGPGGDTLTGGLGNDFLYGGDGADTLEGREANDVLAGGASNDSLAGNIGDDELTGGAGADSFAGSDGADTIRADDDEADTSLSGGAGVDTAYYDAGLDPSPLAVETKISA
jgi:Ca2+-binding RTX toxin-like protein